MRLGCNDMSHWDSENGIVTVCCTCGRADEPQYTTSEGATCFVSAPMNATSATAFLRVRPRRNNAQVQQRLSLHVSYKILGVVNLTRFCHESDGNKGAVCTLPHCPDFKLRFAGGCASGWELEIDCSGCSYAVEPLRAAFATGPP